MMHRANAGYTLIEIMAVTAILGIMAVIAAPRVLQGFQGANMKTGVKRFASTLRAARSYAVSRRALVAVQANLGTGTAQFAVQFPFQNHSQPQGLAAAGAENMSGDNGTGEGQATGLEQIPDYLSEEFQLPEGILFDRFIIDSRENLNEETARVIFYPRGNTSGGTFIISMDSGTDYAITVNQITGRIFMEPLS
jgi:prepilin-type N-terminal cleavage/methylation domain-containing protein